MTRRTPVQTKKPRKQHTQSFKDEALGLADKVGVAQAAHDLGLHDSQLYDWRQKASRRRSQSEVEQSQASEIARLKRLLAEQAEELAIVKNVWSAPDLQASIPSEQNDVCVNVSGLLVQHAAAGLDGIGAHRAP